MGTYSNITIENDQFYSLEKHFEVACNRHPHLKLLESQWRFDQELVSKALQNINTIFPHYSRHDASHSKQIIVNIERMLGDKIKYLSATDTWLILEAAYHHDIGMVITQKQIEDMNTDEFKEFVNQISKEKDNELCEFAENWLNQKAILPQNSEAHAFFHQYTHLLAEWYRRKHPYNSARIVRDPFEEIGLNSPRNELLPKRLFQVLSNICKAHGDDFENVKKLPKAEAGMASEDCHPLYVACLIRMGDLLDVDDNRFCPVMMKMCGSNLPHTSLAHFHKHQSITHFRLDAEQIEITCECPTPESYEAAFDWFNWLEKEYKDQTQYWSEIVPCIELGRLPTLITPRVNINEPYLILEEGKRPDFKINQKVIMELVQGGNLYSSYFDSIRELLQNSVDATILRLWLENKKLIRSIKNPLSEDMNKLYSKYKIEVDVLNNNDEINLIIKDYGVGMDINGLKFLMEVGSSKNNSFKIKEINEMPVWFKPSGCFGIGFQSIFLISDEFTLETKSVDSVGLLLRVKKNLNNRLVISIEENLSIKDIGTTLNLKLNNKIKEKSNFVTWRNLYLANPDFDFIFEGLDSNKKEFFLLKNNIDIFFKNSLISNKENKFKVKESYFCEKNNILISGLKFNFNKDSYVDNDSVKIFFRGQELSELHSLIWNLGKFLKINIDLYGYDAKDILNYSRESIINNLEKIEEEILETVKNYILKEYCSFDEISREVSVLFIFYNFVLNNIDNKYLEILKKIKVNSDLKFLDVIDKLKNKKNLIVDIKNKLNLEDLFDVEKIIKIDNTFRYIISKILESEGYYPFVEYSIEDEDVISYNKKDKFPFSEQSFKNQLCSVNLQPWDINFTRCCMIAWFDVKDLIVDDLLPCKVLHTGRIDDKHKILLPLLFKDNNFEFDESENFNRWVFNHLVNKELTYDEVVSKNKDLIEFLKQKLNK